MNPQKTGIPVKDFEAFVHYVKEGLEQSMEKPDSTYDPNPMFFMVAQDALSIGMIDPDFMRNEMTKDRLSSLMAIQCAKDEADYSAFSCIVYMKKAFGEEGLKEEEERQHRLQDDPKAEELAMVMICTAEEVEMHFAPVVRVPGKGMHLGAWFMMDGMNMSSHFSEKMQAALAVVKVAKGKGFHLKETIEKLMAKQPMPMGVVPVDINNPEEAVNKVKELKKKGPLSGRIQPGN